MRKGGYGPSYRPPVDGSVSAGVPITRMYRLHPVQSNTSKPSRSSPRVTSYAPPQRHSWEKLPPPVSSYCISFTPTCLKANQARRRSPMRVSALGPVCSLDFRHALGLLSLSLYQDYPEDCGRCTESMYVFKSSKILLCIVSIGDCMISPTSSDTTTFLACKSNRQSYSRRSSSSRRVSHASWTSRNRFDA